MHAKATTEVRRHASSLTRATTRTLQGAVISGQYLGSTKIDKFYNAQVIEQYICMAKRLTGIAPRRNAGIGPTIRFNVAVDYAFGVDICQTFQHLHSIHLHDTLVFDATVHE